MENNFNNKKMYEYIFVDIATSHAGKLNPESKNKKI